MSRDAQRPGFAATRSIASIVALTLAALLVAQGAAVAAMRAAGSAHRHVATGATFVLDDLRRGPAASGSTAEHGHAHGAAMRHHHSGGDTSVEFVDGELRLTAGAGDSGTAGLVAAAFVALPSDSRCLAAETEAERAPRETSWSLQMSDLAQPDRPPRMG